MENTSLTHIEHISEVINRSGLIKKLKSIKKSNIMDSLSKNHKYIDGTCDIRNTLERSEKFSYFRRPIKNIIPYKHIGLVDLYQVIIGDYFKVQINELRKITDKKEAQKFKAQNLDYVTFSGTFEKRHRNSLINHSGLLVFDFDELENLDLVKKTLLKDTLFETALLFISPSGNGLKWVIEIDLERATHQEYFEGVGNYLIQKYKLKVDTSGKDIARACYVSHDYSAFINPKYLSNGI